jgi:hypothetical protein
MKKLRTFETMLKKTELNLKTAVAGSKTVRPAKITQGF